MMGFVSSLGGLLGVRFFVLALHPVLFKIVFVRKLYCLPLLLCKS
jgi:hypothetical protein